jgi:hypothetical protein
VEIITQRCDAPISHCGRDAHKVRKQIKRSKCHEEQYKMKHVRNTCDGMFLCYGASIKFLFARWRRHASLKRRHNKGNLSSARVVGLMR